MVDCARVSLLKNLSPMTDFSTLRLKINDLKAKVEHNSISPVYLGAILDEFLAALAAVDANTLNPNLLNDIRRSLDDLDEMVNTNASSINTIRGSIGVPSGIAPLGPDGKVPSANLPASVGGESVREIIEFHSVVSGVEAADSCAWSSTGAACYVVYDSDTDSFLLARNQIIKSQSSAVDDVIDVDLSGGETPLNPEITIRTSYYRMWTDAGSFGTISGGAVKPVSGRIYVCTSDCTLYFCKSSALVLSGAAPAVINRIYEIEAFLQGVDNTQTLTGMLQDLKTEIYNHITLLDVDDIRDQLSDIKEILYKGGHNKSLASQVEDNRTDIEDLASKVSYAMASLRNVDNLSDSNMERLNDLEPRVEALESSMPRAITMEEIDAMFE